MTSSYRELPPAGFPEIVACRWEQIVAGSGSFTPRIIPDARADIIVFADGEVVLVGPTMRPDFPSMSGGVHLRGIRFRTEALSAALGIPASEIRDRQLPLNEVLPRRAVAEIADAIWRGIHPRSLVPRRPDDRVSHAVRRLATEPAVDMAAMSAEVNVSERHLRRLLVEHSGLEPRAINRVARLQRFLRGAERAWPAVGLSALAASSGYSDQAHLTREVRELTGTTPSNLLRERRVA